MTEYKNLEALMFKGFQFTPVINTETNEPWFFVCEIAEILGIVNHSQAVHKAELEDDEKGISLRYTPGGAQESLIVSESGLFGLIANSRKQIGKDLRRFVRKQVLPTLRKTGKFELEQDPTKQALILAENLIEMNKKLVAQKPAVEFAKTMSTCKGSLKVGDFAKILFDKQNLDVGQNRLFTWLRQHKYLMNTSTPYQKYMNMGLFEVASGPVTGSETGRVWKQVKITPKGMVYLTQKILESKAFQVIEV